MTEIFKFLKGLSVFCVAQEVHLEPEDKSHNETHFAQYKECSKSVRAIERMNRLVLCKVVNLPSLEKHSSKYYLEGIQAQRR